MVHEKNPQMNHQMKKNIFYAAATVIMILLITLLLCTDAMSKPQARVLFDDSSYEAKEADYKAELASVLDAYHCGDSGVMLTHTAGLDGTRRYRLQIYNRRFSILTPEEFAALEKAVKNIVILDCKDVPIEIAVDMGYTTI